MEFLQSILNQFPGSVNQGLIWGIMAIGLFISYKILDFSDLTVDGSFATGGCVCVILITNGVNVYLALLIALIAGGLCGLITGLFHCFFGIPPILSGILTQLMLWSINLKILGGSNVACSGRSFNLIVSSLSSRTFSSLAVISIIVIVIILILYYFFGTELGASIRCTGMNPKMASANGINNSINKVVGLVISNSIVAFSGAVLAQYQGFADINMGRGAIVIGLAAIIIGTTLFSKICSNFGVTLGCVAVGGIIYYFVYSIVLSLGIDAELLKMFSAIIVAIFLAIPYLKQKYFKTKSKEKHLLSQGGH